jgi:anaerobic dimethyl sulfoxide reductase subunit C (anchor subunit)
MSHWELPLVFFTVVGQWAVGTAVILAILDQFVPSLAGENENKILRTAGLSVFPLCALALIFSIFHLGQPFAAYRALSNFGNSWLSREIWLFMAFGLLALIYSYTWWKNAVNASSRRILGLLTAAVGLIAVIISSNVYTLPAHVAWNTWQTTAAFLLSAALLGSLTLITVLAYNKNSEANLQDGLKTTGWVTAIALIGIVLTLATFSQQANMSGEQANAVLLTFSSSLFWVRTLFSLVLPGAVALKMLSGAKVAPKTLVSVTLIGAVLGELSGRALFYYSVMSQNPF